MTFAASSTRTVPLGPCLKVTGMNEKSAGDPVGVVRGGVVVRRELFERLRVDISPHVRVPLVDPAPNPPTG